MENLPDAEKKREGSIKIKSYCWKVGERRGVQYMISVNCLWVGIDWTATPERADCNETTLEEVTGQQRWI